MARFNYVYEGKQGTRNKAFSRSVGPRFKVLRTRTRSMMKHQQDYYEWAKSIQHPACFMEMRLGKTMPNIRLIRYWARKELFPGQSCPIVVAAPLSVLATWERELRLEGESFFLIHGKSFDKRVEIAVKTAFGNPGRNWLLINYDGLRSTPGLTLLPWFAVIADESTTIKNPNAKVSKLFVASFRETQHRIILSGLPSPEGELDLFQQFKFLHGHFMDKVNYYDFKYAFFERQWNGVRPKTKRLCPVCKNDLVKKQDCNTCEGKGRISFPVARTIKEHVHQLAFVLMRKDAGIGSKKIVEPRYITMTKEQHGVYRKVEDEFLYLLENGEEKETDHIITQRTWCSRIAGGSDIEGNFKWSPKMTELVSLVKGELSHQPVVVGFKFNSEIFSAQQAMVKAGIPCETLTGADSRDKRIQKQDWFQTSQQKGRVLLVQIQKVAQYGIDLSAADTMIFYSVVYSTEQMSQFQDRIVHPHKKISLLYLYLIAEDTVDVDAYETIKLKMRSAKMFMRKMDESLIQRLEERKAERI